MGCRGHVSYRDIGVIPGVAWSALLVRHDTALFSPWGVQRLCLAQDVPAYGGGPMNETNTPEQMVYYAAMKSARKARDDALDSVLKTHNVAIAATWKTYEAASEDAWRVWEAARESKRKALDAAQNAYNSATKSAQKAYKSAIESARKANDPAKEMGVSQ